MTTHTSSPYSLSWLHSIIKLVTICRQFLLRRPENVRGDWDTVTMAWNVKRLFALQHT
jgi:hypothetical protein